MGGRGEGSREIIKLESEPEFEYDQKKSKSNKEKHGMTLRKRKCFGVMIEGWKIVQRISEKQGIC
jgi:hypothetical protein